MVWYHLLETAITRESSSYLLGWKAMPLALDDFDSNYAPVSKSLNPSVLRPTGHSVQCHLLL